MEDVAEMMLETLEAGVLELSILSEQENISSNHDNSQIIAVIKDLLGASRGNLSTNVISSTGPVWIGTFLEIQEQACKLESQNITCYI